MIKNCLNYLNSLKKSQGNLVKFRNVLISGYKSLNFIEVSDTGHGMSIDDLKKIYLRIGTKKRRQENENNKFKLGDKGIGRLSAMRLGNLLHVKTAKRENKKWNQLTIDWNKFDCDAETSVDNIQLVPENKLPKDDSNFHGTIILIQDLRNDWSYEVCIELIQNRIARFFDPFQPGLANEKMIFMFNGNQIMIPSIPIELLQNAHAVCNATFEFKDGEPVLTGDIDYKLHRQRKAIEIRGVKALTVAGEKLIRRGKKGTARDIEIIYKKWVLKKIEYFDFEIYWYNRAIVENFENFTKSKTESKQQIARWSGGPMLYRHDVRILPYGDPDDDWLEIDKAAFGRPGFKLNRQQLIGKVSLNAPHSILSEQTNREGLIQREESKALAQLIRCILEIEFRNFINKVDNEVRIKKRRENLSKNQITLFTEKLETELKDIEKKSGKDLYSALMKIKSIITKICNESNYILSEIDKLQDQYTEDHDKFLYLAGIGLITEFIFHELDRSVAHTIRTISQDKITEHLIYLLLEQLKTLQKRITSFNKMTTEKRQTKSNIDLNELIQSTVNGHKNEFERHNISTHIQLPERGYKVKAVHGMVLQILENLIVNAVYWLKRQSDYDKNFKPEIQIILDKDGESLYVRDNGPGIPISQKDWVFEPFVSTKPTGSGKGLGLYISRDLAKYHGWTLTADENYCKINKGS